MARYSELVLCGLFVVVALSLQGCGEVANEATVTTKAPTLDAEKEAQEKEDATTSEARQQFETPTCATVCTSYSDGMTVDSPFVCMLGGNCAAPAASTACMADETMVLAAQRRLQEAAPAAPTPPKEGKELVVTVPPPVVTTTTTQPPAGVLCKPIKAELGSPALEKTLFLSGVLPEAVVTSFANFSMAFVAVGFTLMAAMGVVVLRRHSQASAEPSLMDSDSEENLSDA